MNFAFFILCAIILGLIFVYKLLKYIIMAPVRKYRSMMDDVKREARDQASRRQEEERRSQRREYVRQVSEVVDYEEVTTFSSTAERPEPQPRHTSTTATVEERVVDAEWEEIK